MDTNTIKNELEAKAYAKITVLPSNLSFKSTASSKTIKVTCSDSSWTVGGGNDWCTITKVSNTSLSADDFTCIDPWDAKTKVLSSATRYSAPNKAVVFKKS